MTTSKSPAVTSDSVNTTSGHDEDPMMPNTTQSIPGQVFILAPPRSFSSVVCAMIGQHPQMYGLPETHLLRDESMADWWGRAARAKYPMSDGLVRAVAQLCFGEQTEINVQRARGWLRRRLHLTTSYLVEVLAEQVQPLILVEKSPSMVYHRATLQRIHTMFPQARFIHLVRHPRGHGESVMKAIREAKVHAEPPPWLLDLAAFPLSYVREGYTPRRTTDVDPQRGWYVLNMIVDEFLQTISDERKMWIRGEDLLTDPDQGLRSIASWLGLRADDEAIAEMKHPERSPYACFGPPGAPFGNDFFFLQNPVLRPARAEPQTLDGPLSWREDGQGFLPEVQALAHQFGYQ
jgi:hypothetical protein